MCRSGTPDDAADYFALRVTGVTDRVTPQVFLKKYLNIQNSQSIRIIFKILNLYRVLIYLTEILFMADLTFKYK